MLGIETGAAGREASKLHLCHAAPLVTNSLQRYTASCQDQGTVPKWKGSLPNRRSRVRILAYSVFLSRGEALTVPVFTLGTVKAFFQLISLLS